MYVAQPSTNSLNNYTVNRKITYVGTPFAIGPFSGCSGVVVEHRTRNRDVAGLTRTRFTASNLEQVANLLCVQDNSAAYPQRDGK